MSYDLLGSSGTTLSNNFVLGWDFSSSYDQFVSGGVYLLDKGK